MSAQRCAYIDKEQGMKTHLMILLVATITVAGCNSNPTRQEVGKEMERK